MHAEERSQYCDGGGGGTNGVAVCDARSTVKYRLPKEVAK